MEPSKVLVVDGDSGMRRACEMAILGIGAYSIFMAESANEGLRILRQNPDICLIVAEFQLPDDRGGGRFLREAKGINRNMPIIVTGKNLDGKARGEISRSGASEFLSKPVFQAQLLNLLRSRLPRLTE